MKWISSVREQNVRYISGLTIYIVNKAAKYLLKNGYEGKKLHHKVEKY